MSLKIPYAATAYGLFKFIKHQSTSDLDIATHFFRPRNERKHLSLISLLRLRLLPEIFPRLFCLVTHFFDSVQVVKVLVSIFLEFAEFFHNFVINSFFFPDTLLEYSILPPIAVETSFVVTTETEHFFFRDTKHAV